MEDFFDDEDDLLLETAIQTEHQTAVAPTKFDHNTDDTPAPHYLGTLMRHFGHDKFRPMQWRIIRSIIEDKRDHCVIMATGYGKSLTYQFPSVHLGTITLVVSPLISLMEDQVLSLNLSNIPACLLGTAQKQKDILADIYDDQYRIVYVTPEYVTGEAGEHLLKRLADKLSLIAIDEAHCTSQWGHDFRPAYRSLGCIRRTLPNTPILAVTATATAKVRDDIVKLLNLRNPQHLCTGFDRPNLEFCVNTKSDVGVWTDLKPYLTTKKPDGSLIIYCLTRKQTEEIVELLKSHGVECGGYHAGLSLKQRKNVHEEFVRDRLQVIVATVAFGMGIDKPDVRLVIHYGMAKDMESYYQEAGRAGRDGQPAKCVLFYSRGDFKTHEILRELSNSGSNFKKHLEELSQKMMAYLNTRDCRRLFILQYFEGAGTTCTPRANCCDNCARKLTSASDETLYEGLDAAGKYDYTQDTRLLLQAVQAFKGKSGIAIPILLLRGSQSKKLHSNFYNHPVYGLGKEKSEEYWKCLSELLQAEKFLMVKKSQNTYAKSAFAVMHTIMLQEKATHFLDATSPITLRFQTPANMFKFLKKKKPQYLYEDTSPVGKSQSAGVSVSSSPQQLTNFAFPKNLAQDLLKLLLRKRSELSTSLDVMPYMIASNLALTQLATKRPLNLDEMRAMKVDGFSEVKIIKFGPSFLQCIQQKMNFLPATSSQDAGDGGNTETLESVLEKNPFGGAKGGARKELAYSKFKSGFTVPMIANEMQVQPSTVIAYLVDLMKCGCKFTRADLRLLGVSDVVFENVRVVLPDLKAENCVRLTELKEQLAKEITFDQVRLVATWFQIRQHASELGIPFCDEGTEVRATKPPLMEKSEDPPRTEPENLWGDESDSMDFDMDQVMNDLENKSQPQSQSDHLVASQNFVETSNIPTATLSQPKLLSGAATKPQLSKLKATKRVIYEQTSSDDEMNDVLMKSDDPPVKRALPNWMGKGVVSGGGGSSGDVKPPSKFQFKQKKTMF